MVEFGKGIVKNIQPFKYRDNSPAHGRQIRKDLKLTKGDMDFLLGICNDAFELLPVDEIDIDDIDISVHIMQ